VKLHIHLVPRSKNEWSYISTPHYAFMEWCSVKKSTALSGTLQRRHHYEELGSGKKIILEWLRIRTSGKLL
jgi:hypothetical protein